MRWRYLAIHLSHLNRRYAALLEQLVEEKPDDEPTDGLPRIEQAILEALQDGRPQPGKKAARASGYAYSPRLRATLADLCRRNILTHGPDGYKLAPSSSGRAPAPTSASLKEKP